MTEATVNSTLLGSELKFLAPEEVAEVKTLDHFTKYYIRQQPPAASIEKKINELQDVRDGQRYVEVTEAWAIWTNPETGERIAVNGNTRKHAYVRMQNTPSFKDAIFQPVPYRDFLAEPTPENLIKYQRQVNDTTESHDILQLAEAAHTYKEERLAYYMSEQGGSLKQREAAKKSTEDLKMLFGNQYGDSYLSRLRKLATAPAWIKELLRLGILTSNAIDALDRHLKKEENAGLTEETVINAIRAELQLKNETLISDTSVNNYFKARAAALNPPASTGGGAGGAGGGDGGGGAGGAGGGTGKGEKTPKTEEELISLINPVSTALLALDSDLELDTSKGESVVTLENEMLNTVALVFPYLPVGHRQSFFNQVRDLFLNVLDNPKVIATEAAGDIDKVYKAYAKVANAAKKLTLRADDSVGVVEIPEDVAAAAESEDEAETTEHPAMPEPLVISDANFTATIS